MASDIEKLKSAALDKWPDDAGQGIKGEADLVIMESFLAGYKMALKDAAEIAYSANNHEEHEQWIIPTGPNSDRCGWCACQETIAELLDPDDYKGTGTPGIHNNDSDAGKDKQDNGN